MTKEKNFTLLVEAFSLLKQHLPNAHLTIVGDGPERSAVEMSAGAELGHSIVLPGPSYDESEIARYMLAADALVMGGRIGQAINHALAYDLPVIAFARTPDGRYHGSEIGSLLSGVTGHVVPEYTASCMADSILAFFTLYPEPKSVFQAPIRRFVGEHLTIDKMVDGFRALDRHLRNS